MENQDLLSEMSELFSKPFSDEAVEAFETALADMEREDPEHKGATEAYTNALIEIKKASKESYGIIIAALIHRCLSVSDVMSLMESEKNFLSTYMLSEIVKSDTSLGRLTKEALKHQDNNE